MQREARSRAPRARLPWRYVIAGDAVSAATMELRPGAASAAATRAWVRIIARLMLIVTRLRFRIRASGGVPEGGSVLVSHHDSYWDGVVAAALDPRIVPIVSRNWRTIRGVGWFLSIYGVLWTGEDTVERAAALVHEGATVWIAPFAFPRAGERPPAHTGAAIICMQGGVPLIPVSLEGLSRADRPRLLRARAHAAFGAPISPAPGEDARALTARFESLLRS